MAKYGVATISTSTAGGGVRTCAAELSRARHQSVFDAAMASAQESGLRENCTSRLSERAEGGRTLDLSRLYSFEAGEQRGAIRRGVGGAKGGDQGKCEPAKHVPDAESGKRVTSAGAHTEDRKGKEEGEVHRALPPSQHRSAGGGVLRAQGRRSTRRGSADMDGL